MDSLDAYQQRATEYLAKNEELRAQVGAQPQDVLTPHPLGEGEHNVNFRFSVPSKGHDEGKEAGQQCFVLRVNVLPQPFHTCQVRYEFDALTAVAASGCTPLPIYVDSSRTALGKGVLVETFCPGRVFDLDELQPDDLKRCARILGAIHSVPVPEDCPLHHPTDPLQGLFDECIERFQLYRDSPYEDARITAWVDLFTNLTIQAIQRAQAAPCDPRIVNTETLASHFLLPNDSETGWFVDWERPLLGDVAQDLAFFLTPTTTFWDSDRFFTAQDQEMFLREYWRAVDGRFNPGGFEERFPAWMKVSALRAVAWCCKALIRYGGSGEHTTARAAAKLPRYLSDDFLEMLLEECFT